jgi:hypothetical protein
MKASMLYGPSRPKVTVRGVAERTRENTESLRSLDDGANGASRVTDSGTSRVSVRREVKHGTQLYERRPRTENLVHIGGGAPDTETIVPPAVVWWPGFSAQLEVVRT